MMVDGLLGYLVNAAWEAPLLAAGAWLLTQVSRLGPRTGNRVWLACLALSVVLPMTDLSRVAEPAGSNTAALVSKVARAIAPPRLELTLDNRVALTLIAVFAGVLMFGAGRLLVGWLAVRRLVRDAQAVALPPDVAAELAAVAAAHRAPVPQVMQSGATSTPVVAGAFRPVILIPVNIIERPEDQLRAALLHELAHVIRRDYAINLTSEVAALPLIWHPVLHAIKAEVRRSRELACDAMASAAMRSETAYAKSLVALANASGVPSSRGAPAIVGLFGKPLLEERLMHLIGPKRTPNATLKIAGIVAGAVVVAGVIGAAAFLHVPTVLAQPSAADPAIATQAAPETPAQAKTRMKVMELIDDPKTRKQLATAEKEFARAQAEADSPAFRARAKAAALKALADPETQAELTRANNLERTPEVRKAGQDLQAAAKRLRALDHAERQ